MVELSHLSYSSISTYQLCPRSWRFRYVDKVAVPTAPALAFGSAFHGTIEHLIRYGGVDQPTTISGLWTEHWRDAQQQNIDWAGELPEQMETEGLRLLLHPESTRVLSGLRPLVEDGEPVIERKVELRVPGVPLPVIGYIDLISADGVPHDFKTSSRAWTPAQAQGELQPLFYLAALNQAGYSRNPNRLFRHIVWVKTKTPQVQVLESCHAFGEMFWLFGVIADVWRGIEHEVFPPNPGAWKCSDRWCEYWSYCRGKP